jgi:AraC-like DNA-binding protein/quercetin dioxygenase-like cupin family protein
MNHGGRVTSHFLGNSVSTRSLNQDEALARLPFHSYGYRACMSATLLHQAFLPTDAQPVQAYMWKYSPVNGGRRPRHFHVEPELNLVVHGWAEFGVGDSVVRAGPGEVVGFPAGQDHVLLAASPDLFLFALGMTPMLASEVVRGQVGETAVPLSLRLNSKDLDALTRRAEQVVERAGTEQPCAELWEHIHWLSRSSATAAAAPIHVLTKRALQLVAESPELSLEGVARGVKGCASEISRYFHRDIGMTFVHYRARIRLLRFMRLAEESRGNLTAAAIAAGFGSYSQCHRAFQADLGCSPRAFLKAGVRQQMQLAYADDAARAAGSGPRETRAALSD